MALVGSTAITALSAPYRRYNAFIDRITINSHYARMRASVQATGQLLHHDNIICLTGEPKGRYASRRVLRKGLMPMVTYGELFTFVIMLCAVITLVINITRKK